MKQLRLPAMSAEFEKLAREAANANEGYEQYLLRLSELEVAARTSNALRARIKQAGFAVLLLAGAGGSLGPTATTPATRSG